MLSCLQGWYACVGTPPSITKTSWRDSLHRHESTISHGSRRRPTETVGIYQWGKPVVCSRQRGMKPQRKDAGSLKSQQQHSKYPQPKASSVQSAVGSAYQELGLYSHQRACKNWSSTFPKLLVFEESAIMFVLLQDGTEWGPEQDDHWVILYLLCSYSDAHWEWHSEYTTCCWMKCLSAQRGRPYCCSDQTDGRLQNQILVSGILFWSKNGLYWNRIVPCCMRQVVDSNSILADDFKSNYKPAGKVEHFAKSVFENWCCEPQSLDMDRDLTRQSKIQRKSRKRWQIMVFM